MKIFVYEHVTGGGMDGLDLPPALAAEADMMLRALVRDLAELPGVIIRTSRDPRLTPLPEVETITPAPRESPLALFARGLDGVDAAWPTAPEAGGMLERLARATLDGGRLLLGCRPEALRLASSKRATSRVLQESGIPVVATFTRGESLPGLPGPWVVKPDDGAGCEGIQRVADWRAARRILEAAPTPLVAQPWIEGEARSLSLLCADGRAEVLSINRQRVGFVADGLVLEGLCVNTSVPNPVCYDDLASRIASAVPGLWGYIGVDLIATPHGPVVLEINPRLTTSYCALKQAREMNVPGMVLDLLAHGKSPAQQGPRGREVEILLEVSRVH